MNIMNIGEKILAAVIMLLQDVGVVFAVASCVAALATKRERRRYHNEADHSLFA